VFALDFSPDGRAIAVGYARELEVWDLLTAKRRFSRTGPGPFPIESLAFSPDGRWIIAGYGSFNEAGTGSAQLIDAATGAQLGETFPGHENGVFDVACSPDGRQVALTSGEIVDLWDVETHKLVHSLSSHSGFIHTIAFSRDGRYLASGGMDKVIKLWDRATGRQVRSFAGHKGFIRDVTFSPDNVHFASAAEDKSIKLWSVDSDRELATLHGHQNYVHCLAFSPDGHLLASGGFDQTTKVWFATPSLQLTFHGHDGWVSGVAFGRDSDRVASASSILATGNFLQLWDAVTGERIQSFPMATTPVQSLAFSRDGRRLATIGLGDRVQIWDAAKGRSLVSNKGQRATAVLPYHIEGGRRQWFNLPRPGSGAIAYSPDGRQFAVGGDSRTVRIHDAQTGQEINVLEGHTARVRAIAYSPDGSQVASAGDDRTVILWELDSARATRTLRGHKAPVHGVAFDPSGGRLASVGGDFERSGKPGESIVWDSSTGVPIHQLRGHTDVVSGVAFSPDGRRLATSSLDRTVKLWDTGTGQEVFTLRGHTHGVLCVAFSPDGQRIVSGSIDQTAKVWDITQPTADQLLRRAAASQVAELLKALLLKSAVMEQIGRDAGQDVSLRALEQEMARRSIEDPSLLNDTSWLIARDSKRSPGDYQKAIQYAEVACRLAPDEGTFVTTLGVSRYRAGHLREAATELDRSAKLNASEFGAPLPADLAFAAMAAHKLGQTTRSHRTLEQLRDLMKTQPWAGDAESKAFLAEAIALFERPARPNATLRGPTTK
jgi:WD40 repeat protein